MKNLCFWKSLGSREGGSLGAGIRGIEVDLLQVSFSQKKMICKWAFGIL